MRTRRRSEPAPPPDDHPVLFEVEMPTSASESDAEEPTSKKCSECPRILRSKKAIAAGVGPGCAAKIGREVIASRLSSTVRRRKTSEAA